MSSPFHPLPKKKPPLPKAHTHSEGAALFDSAADQDRLLSPDLTDVNQIFYFLRMMICLLLVDKGSPPALPGRQQRFDNSGSGFHSLLI